MILKGPIWIHHNGFSSQVIFGYPTSPGSLSIAVDFGNPSIHNRRVDTCGFNLRLKGDFHLLSGFTSLYAINILYTILPLEGTCSQEIQRILTCDQVHHCKLLLLLAVLAENPSFKTYRATQSEDILLSGIGPAGFWEKAHILTYCSGGFSSLHSLKPTFCP